MKFQISENVRVQLTNKYLDLAERLQRLNWGFIAKLQDIRRLQRTKAQEAFTQTRPPEGTEVEYVYFRLVEMFHIEDLDKLWKGLSKLIPAIQNVPRYKEFFLRFRRDAESLSAGAGGVCGIVGRSRENSASSDVAYRGLSGLPEEVDFIEIELDNILPSIVILKLNVHVTDAVTRQINELHDKQYLSILESRRISPWGITREYSLQPSQEVMKQKIVTRLNELRSRVEQNLGSFLKGYFALHSNKKGVLLPVWEVYVLKGVPEDEKAFQEWSEGTKSWWESFGFYSDSADTYRQTGLIFQWPRFIRHSEPSVNRLFVLWEPYRRVMDTERFGMHEKEEIIRLTKGTLNAMLLWITIYHFSLVFQREIEKLRNQVYGRMKLKGRMRPCTRLNEKIHNESLQLDRVSMEYDHRGQSSIMLMMAKQELSNLKSDRTVGIKELGDAIDQEIKFRIEMLRKHLSLVSDSFSQYLVTRNMAASYSLQWWILILTLVLAFTSIITIVANPLAFKTFLVEARDFLSALIRHAIQIIH